ncbi:MAG: NTP transferase domain-containing protein [Candidatus Nitrosotenuis sp.]|uniref:5-deoxyadenosylcobinamide phosphate nucleotidyltransferase n=1 Tax=Candidatus Nitrosotenuis uzonensis TaxID=1407055 RepID=A0A812F2Y6_9ARCH|nr:NTP transferase domain-containing protein [Candidatus Nitrosotenuis uzonensis]CAE6493072.1 5-deoxyadenosylcobinamide phosphate nucleotidyltransferase [Candidatus Nitrosotenuis uzonensis]
MIGLVMAGGRGTRMGLNGEKLLLQHGKPVVLCVVDAMRESKCFTDVIAVTSHNSPKTQQMLSEYGVRTIQTSGEGYVQDLMTALSFIDEIALVISGDLPLVDSKIIRNLVDMHKEDSAWHSFVVTKRFLDEQKMAAEFSVVCQGQDCYYTGVSIVNPKKITTSVVAETYTILDDKRIALNLNTKYDYSLLEDA